VIAAVHPTIPSKLLYLKNDFASADIYSRHPHVFQARNGFVDGQGSVKIMFQLQYIP